MRRMKVKIRNVHFLVLLKIEAKYKGLDSDVWM